MDYLDSEQIYIDELVSRYCTRYVETQRNVMLGRGYNPVGEIDLLCKRHDGRFDAYEVKARHTRSSMRTAVSQLRKIRRFMSSIVCTYAYFYDTDEVIRVD